ncbi:hypothetical protein BOTBODRAFT_148707 [Botryobasidium botryosum FD-172 SS1]|uniref:Altered inheritance of mitochondria protein 9, mitochondrial n=1 Tax=Botryobasidium botryosum (strain FD-172 SS1) TaxID=930990 RepID=A0A067M1B4_BOTB1|nr:hypothetical protein BOTBODRAFT_148707 [Botryobasidium botryosum FD-172 SS1]
MACRAFRWLNNERAHPSIRRLDFNIEAPGDRAAKATGAAECTNMVFEAEGGFNRASRVIMDNGRQVIARIPFPNAGPQRITTQSQVATMDFVHTRFRAPVPNVLAYEASRDNPVGCEYIIMERCTGSVVESQDGITDGFLNDLADFQVKLAATTFSQYGSIYHKEHVSSELEARPLYSDGAPDDECSQRLKVGPSVERARMDIDRGPWRDVNSYLCAAVACEAGWIRFHLNTPQAQVQLGAKHTLGQHISLPSNAGSVSHLLFSPKIHNITPLSSPIPTFMPPTCS